MIENHDFESKTLDSAELDSTPMQNDYIANFESGRPNSKFNNFKDRLLASVGILLAMTIGTGAFAQSGKADLRQQAKNSIKLGEIVPKVKAFFTAIEAETAFSKSGQEEFLDNGLKELEKKADTTKTLEGLQSVLKETSTFVGQFSGSKTKEISNHGEKMKFKKGDLEEGKATITNIKKEITEANGLFDKNTADLYDETVIDNTVLTNLKNQMTTIKNSLDEQKKSLMGIKDLLAESQKKLGETSANLIDKKIKLAQLTKAYSVWKNNPPKTDKEAKDAEGLEKQITIINKEISDLEAELKVENTAISDLQDQAKQMSAGQDSTMISYQTTVSNIHEEELAIYKKQQVELNAKLDNSIDTLKSIIKGKEAIVSQLDSNLESISNDIKNQTQSGIEDGGKLEAFQQERLKAIETFTQVNKEMQTVIIQAQEYLKGIYAVQLKKLASSKEYYTQEKNLLLADTTEIVNQIKQLKTEIKTLQEKKNTIKQSLANLSSAEMADKTKEMLDIMNQITSLNSKLEQLDKDEDQKDKELDVTNQELIYIDQVEKIIKGYDQRLELMVNLIVLWNNFQEYKLQNDYTQRDTKIKEDLYTELESKLNDAKNEVTKILNSKTSSDAEELTNAQLLSSKTQEVNSLEAQLKAMEISRQNSRDRLKSEGEAMSKLIEEIKQKLKQEDGTGSLTYIVTKNDLLRNNKYFENIVNPEVLEPIVNVKAIQKSINGVTSH